MTQLDILKQLCVVMAGISGLPCVIGDQDAPPPKGSHVCIRVIDVEVPTHDTTAIVESSTAYTETVRGQSYCNLEIMVTGSSAMDTARKIVSGLQHSARQFDLWNTIGYGGFTGPQNLSEGFGGQFRQKSMVNLYFYANLEYTDSADYFKTAGLEVIVPGFINEMIEELHVSIDSITNFDEIQNVDGIV